MIRLWSRAVLLFFGAVWCVPGVAQFSTADYSVSVTSDVKYGEGELDGNPNLDLLMDIYSPTESTNTYRPVLLVVHGGAWSTGWRKGSNLVAHAEYFAARGFVSASINYRKIPDGVPDAPQSWFDEVVPLGLSEDQAHASYAAMVDTASAVRYLRANAELYGINPNRIFGFGSSAGAFNVLHTGLDDASFFASTLAVNNLNESSALQLVINFWGGMLRLDEVDASDPAVMTVHGTNDTTVPYTAATLLDDALTTAGVTHEFNTLTGAGHGAWGATVNGNTLEEVSHSFVLNNGNIDFDPDSVYVDFTGDPGAGSSASPFDELTGAVRAANLEAIIRISSGDSEEALVIDKATTLVNETPGSGVVRIGFSPETADSEAGTGYISR